MRWTVTVLLPSGRSRCRPARRPVRRPRRPEPAGHRRAAARAATGRCGSSPTRLPISRPAVSRHLRLLKEAGLVTDRAEGTRRLYRLHDEGIEAVRAYLEEVWGDAAARFRLLAENTSDVRPARPELHRRLPARARVRAVDGRDLALVAERPLGLRPIPDLTSRSSRASAGGSSSAPPTGEEHDWGEVSPGSRRGGWPTCGTCASTAPTPPRSRSPSPRDGDETAVTIVHRGWERLGALGPERRERNPRGWAGLLPHFERACADAA